MNRSDALQLLYVKARTASEFNFDNLFHPPIMYYLSLQDIAQLNKIATSVRLSSKPNEKYNLINNIMLNRGFVKLASGTNRVVYRFEEDYSFVLKIAIDKVGCKDNPMEMVNQHLLKPFVTKCFDVTRCGTVGMFERVVPITYREEFIAISDDVFNLINNLIGKYVIDDIGEKYFQNYGIRNGFGPVLLDYPYVYELDGAKLRCNVIDPITRLPCLGEIDYDIGYNDLICKKCGKRFIASDLKTSNSEDTKIIVEGKDDKMKISLMRGNQVVSSLNNTHKAVDTIKKGIKSGRLNDITLVLESSSGKPQQDLPTIKSEDPVNFHPSLVISERRVEIPQPSQNQDKKFEKVETKNTESETIQANLGDVIEQYVQANMPIPESIKQQIAGTELEKFLHEKDEPPVSEQEETHEEVVETLSSGVIVDDSASIPAAINLDSGLIIESENGTVIASLIDTQLEKFRAAVSFYDTYKDKINDKIKDNDTNNQHNHRSDESSNSPEIEEEEVEHVSVDEVVDAVPERDLEISEREIYNDSKDPIDTTSKYVEDQKPEKESQPQRDINLMSKSFNVESVVGRKIREAYYSIPKTSEAEAVNVKLTIRGRETLSDEEKKQIAADF